MVGRLNSRCSQCSYYVNFTFLVLYLVDNVLYTVASNSDIPLQNVLDKINTNLLIGIPLALQNHDF